MLPQKPKQLEVNVIEATIKKVEDSKNEDGRFEVKCLKSSDGMDGWFWQGMLLKDLYTDREWHKILPKLKPLYLAMHGGWNNTLEVEVWYENDWHTIWSASNHFDTFAEADKSEKGYSDYIIKEGKKIAKMIDQNKSFKYINSKLGKGHSGNTYGCAFHYGFSKAKNKENRERARKAYNLSCGGTGEEKGTINPAVLNIGIPAK